MWGYKRKKFLTPIKEWTGYYKVNLSKNGQVKAFKLHRLVADAYIDNPEGFRDVNHKDENKENNCANNLEWISHKDNCNYGSRNQRISEAQKKTYPQ